MKQKSLSWIENECFILPFLFFIFYLITGPKDIVSFADSLEVVGASHALTIAHPPGFAFYVIFTKFLTSLLFFVKSIYLKYSIVTSIYGALSISFLMLTVKKIMKDIKTPIMAGMLLGLNHEFWLYSMLPEVFSLNILIVSVITFLSVKWYFEEKNIYLYITTLLIGLSFSNHWTGCLMAIPVFILMLSKKIQIKTFLFSALFGILGLSFVLTMFLLAKKTSSLIFPYQDNFNSLFAIATRKRYGAFTAGGVTTHLNFDSVLFYLRNTLFQYAYLGVPIALVGAVKLFKVRKAFLAFLLILIISGPAFIYYMNIKGDSITAFGMMERFHIMPNFFLIFLMAIGFTYLFELLKIRSAIYALAIIVMTVNLIRNNFQETIRYNDNITRSFTDMVLDGIEDNSVIFTYNDAETFALDYALHVEKKKNNVLVFNVRGFQLLMENFSHVKNYINDNNIKINLDFNRVYSVNDFIMRNSSYVPTYILIHAIKDDLPLKNSKFMLSPTNGLAFRIDSKPNVNELNLNAKIFNPYYQQLEPAANPFNDQMNKIYTTTLARFVVEYEKLGRKDIAQKILFMGSKMTPQFEGAVNYYKLMLADSKSGKSI